MTPREGKKYLSPLRGSRFILGQSRTRINSNKFVTMQLMEDISRVPQHGRYFKSTSTITNEVEPESGDRENNPSRPVAGAMQIRDIVRQLFVQSWRM